MKLLSNDDESVFEELFVELDVKLADNSYLSDFDETRWIKKKWYFSVMIAEFKCDKM